MTFCIDPPASRCRLEVPRTGSRPGCGSNTASSVRLCQGGQILKSRPDYLVISFWAGLLFDRS